jgi:hypothetical protein
MNPFNTTVTMQHSAISTSVQHIQLSHWLQATIEPKTDMARRARDLVLKIRSEPDTARQKELKKDLPAVAVGCVIRKGEKRQHENIESLTGWMQFDIDPDGNPEISDWPELRDRLAQLVYVAFVGLSVRGRGVWGLVKVKHPDQLADHFQQFTSDVFGAFGIVLDTTKGGNPTDLRFYSYDPDAILKMQFKVYDRLPEYRTRKVTRKTSHSQTDVFTFARKYVEKRWKYKGAPFQGGGMHRSIYQLCCVLNRKGVPQHEAERYINDNLIPLDQVKSNCIDDPYRRNRNEFGTWQDADPEPAPTRRHKPNQQPTRQQQPPPPEPPPPAPYGFNPYTGEVFDQRCYPADWDAIPLPGEGEPERTDIERIYLAESDQPEILQVLADVLGAEIVPDADPAEIDSFWAEHDRRANVTDWRTRTNIPQSRAG